MKRTVFYLLGVALCVVSCSNEDDFIKAEDSSEKESLFSEITVTEEGYLSFPTMSSLEEYFEEIQNSDSEEFYRDEITRSNQCK